MYVLPTVEAVDELPLETSEKSAAPPEPEELPVVDDEFTSEKSGLGLSLENVMGTSPGWGLTTRSYSSTGRLRALHTHGLSGKTLPIGARATHERLQKS